MSSLSWRNLSDSVRAERVNAVITFGFTERQARFLVHVLVYAGVFLERQYRAFAGIAHGQRTHDFLAKLVGRGYATVITPGSLHRGRLFHVEYKPLYEAIGEPNNRHRKPASLGRYVERLMLLDAVLADTHYTWLGTENDKLAYFILGLLKTEFRKDWYPHLTFGEGDNKTIRYFPDKLPIGVPRDGGRRHVFLYLVTGEVPTDFRFFVMRHAELLRSVDEWTIRFLVPRRFRKAAALYRYAARDELATPLKPSTVDELDWYFRARQGTATDPSPDPDLDLATATRKFGAARFLALHRAWQREGPRALWSAQSHILRDHIHMGRGRIEFAELSHQYLQLTSLVGVA
ncbi:MAG TPA: hypothetical protein VMO26_18085 [Vicinamibacterales bacterium]|nr:hypothetical protein [Vicinamibacterales bacterium]